jgi:hypothetical protein
VVDTVVVETDVVELTEVDEEEPGPPAGTVHWEVPSAVAHSSVAPLA